LQTEDIEAVFLVCELLGDLRGAVKVDLPAAGNTGQHVHVEGERTKRGGR
jgi:hypothetical protein